MLSDFNLDSPANIDSAKQYKVFFFFLSFFLSFFLGEGDCWAHNNVVTPPLPVKRPGHPFLSLPSCSSVVVSFVLFFFCLDAWPKFQCCPIDPCPSCG